MANIIDTANCLENYVNECDSIDFDKFAKHITTRVHRTLQQKMMKLFMACIEEWSKQTNFDARNEATIKLCQKIIAAAGDKYDRYLPLI